jgi:hypothetical protein
VQILRQPHFRHRLPDSFEGTVSEEDALILFSSARMPELTVALTSAYIRRWLHSRSTTISSSSEGWLLRSLFAYDSFGCRAAARGWHSELAVVPQDVPNATEGWAVAD